MPPVASSDTAKASMPPPLPQEGADVGKIGGIGRTGDDRSQKRRRRRSPTLGRRRRRRRRSNEPAAPKGIELGDEGVVGAAVVGTVICFVGREPARGGQAGHRKDGRSGTKRVDGNAVALIGGASPQETSVFKHRAVNGQHRHKTVAGPALVRGLVTAAACRKTRRRGGADDEGPASHVNADAVGLVVAGMAQEGRVAKGVAGAGEPESYGFGVGRIARVIRAGGGREVGRVGIPADVGLPVQIDGQAGRRLRAAGFAATNVRRINQR